MSDLTRKEFAVVSKVLQTKEPTRTAARLVLIEGKTVTEAVAATGCLQPSVSRVVRRCRETHDFILTGYAKQETEKSGE